MNKQDDKYMWNLQHIYENENNIYKDINKIISIYDMYLNFEGNLNTEDNIYKYLELSEKVEMIEEKVYSYLLLRKSINQDDKFVQKVEADIYALTDKYTEKLIFIKEELLSLSDEILDKMMNESRFKKNYLLLENIKDEKKRKLSKEEELLISYVSEGKDAAFNMYNYLTESEMVFEDVKDKKGKLHKISNAKYLKYLTSNDECLRKNAYYSVMNAYKRHNKSLSESYIGMLKSASKFIKYRKYNSYIEYKLEDEYSNLNVYNTLLKSTENNLKILFKFKKLNKKIYIKKGLIKENENIKPWDSYLNPFVIKEKNIPFEEAKNIVKNALSILGNEYINKLEEGFNNNWIDVYAKKNKESGAFNLGVYGVHPFVLLNYEGILDDISTLAHELGHSMHTYYADSNNDIGNSKYGIMIAEIASTLNEIILANYLIKNEKNKNKKASLIYNQIEMIVSTLYTQTMFAEFEEKCFKAAEENIPIYADFLNDTYKSLILKYSGKKESKKANKIAELSKYNWTRISHFYRPFYVYKYATGIVTAINIYLKILEDKDEMVEKYINSLKKGGSIKPLELLKNIDIDLENENIYNKAFKYLDNLINNLAELIK